MLTLAQLHCRQLLIVHLRCVERSRRSASPPSFTMCRIICHDCPQRERASMSRLLSVLLYAGYVHILAVHSDVVDVGVNVVALRVAASQTCLSICRGHNLGHPQLVYGC
jgi:hypothetical protein